MIETEIKFAVDDIDDLRERVRRAGGEQIAAFFEDNIVYDDRTGSLSSEKRVLRLRKSDRIVFTYNRPIEKGRFKVTEELEVEVSDFGVMDEILRSLGYEKVFRYQKRRSICRLGDVKIFFDVTPIGDFVEVEGSTSSIENAAPLLGLDIEKGVSKSYRELYREHCRGRGIEPAEMIF